MTTVIATFLESVMQEQHIPGLMLGLQQGDKLLEEHYLGHANLEHRVPVTAETVFEIASITKLFTTQAILLLVQENQLRLDDTLSNYLDDLPETWKRVTIQQCLTHQSGIPSYTGVDRYWELTKVDKTHAEVLALVRDLPLNFEPGTRYSYDNTGFYLLGMVIEAVSQKPYGDFLRERILEPLKMTHTQANDYTRIIPNRAQGYIYYENELTNKPFYSISNTFSAGVLLSNVQDFLRWRASLFDDSILNAELRRLWWTPHPSAEANERKEGFTLGLGWFRLDTPQGTLMGHNGGTPGFVSAFFHFPETDVTGIFFCNGGHVGAPHQIAQDVITKLGIQ